MNTFALDFQNCDITATHANVGGIEQKNTVVISGSTGYKLTCLTSRQIGDICTYSRQNVRTDISYIDYTAQETAQGTSAFTTEGVSGNNKIANIEGLPNAKTLLDAVGFFTSASTIAWQESAIMRTYFLNIAYPTPPTWINLDTGVRSTAASDAVKINFKGAESRDIAILRIYQSILLPNNNDISIAPTIFGTWETEQEVYLVASAPETKPSAMLAPEVVATKGKAQVKIEPL